MTARMPPSTRLRSSYSPSCGRGEPREREPTLEGPVPERGWGYIACVPQRRVDLTDRRTNFGSDWRQGFEVEPVQPPRVAGQNLATDVLGPVVQGPPDGELGMRCEAFLVRIVAAPHDVIGAHVVDHRILKR